MVQKYFLCLKFSDINSKWILRSFQNCKSDGKTYVLWFLLQCSIILKIGEKSKINQKCLLACESHAISQCMATLKPSYCSVIILELCRTVFSPACTWKLVLKKTKKKEKATDSGTCFFPLLSFSFLSPEGFLFFAKENTQQNFWHCFSCWGMNGTTHNH